MPKPKPKLTIEQREMAAQAEGYRQGFDQGVYQGRLEVMRELEEALAPFGLVGRREVQRMIDRSIRQAGLSGRMPPDPDAIDEEE